MSLLRYRPEEIKHMRTDTISAWMKCRMLSIDRQGDTKIVRMHFSLHSPTPTPNQNPSQDHIKRLRRQDTLSRIQAERGGMS